MQYLVSVIHDSASLATDDEMATIDVFNERLQAEGHWVFAVGLGAPSTATVIDNRGEEAVITDHQRLRTYECDGLAHYKVTPALVVLPETTEQVAAVVRACS